MQFGFYLRFEMHIMSLSLIWSCCVSSIRVPDDSDSQSGVIKQRQNCLESRRLEGQELPVLTLAPCIGTEGVPAINQVSRHGVRKTDNILALVTVKT